MKKKVRRRMNLHKLYLTKNECYQAAAPIVPAGIMVHSTGANNPRLSRYVGPDDGLLGENRYGNHWNQPRPDGRQICPHAFIGRLADGSVATYQVLPWTIRGWHSASGSAGSANRMGYIGFEICEDGLTDAAYFAAVYREAVELCAYLCCEYDIKPEKPTLIDHAEGHTLGIASNHGDVAHWFPRFGKSMDTFRADVAEVVQGVAAHSPASTPQENPKGPTDAGADKPSDPPDAAAPWAADAWAAAYAAGVLDGTRPQEAVTRQELSVVLDRIGTLRTE